MLLCSADTYSPVAPSAVLSLIAASCDSLEDSPAKAMSPAFMHYRRHAHDGVQHKVLPASGSRWNGPGLPVTRRLGRRCMMRPAGYVIRFHCSSHICLWDPSQSCPSTPKPVSCPATPTNIPAHDSWGKTHRDHIGDLGFCKMRAMHLRLLKCSQISITWQYGLDDCRPERG